VVSPFQKKNDMVNSNCLICGDECSRGSKCPFKAYWEEAVRLKSGAPERF